MHVSQRVNVPQIMREGLPLTINQYTNVNWPSLGLPFYAQGPLMQNKLGILGPAEFVLLLCIGTNIFRVVL